MDGAHQAPKLVLIRATPVVLDERGDHEVETVVAQVQRVDLPAVDLLERARKFPKAEYTDASLDVGDAG